MKLNPRLLKEIRQSRIFFLISIILGVLAGICIILQSRGISNLISQVFLRGKELKDVSGILISVTIILFLRVGFAWMGDLCSSSGARRIKQDLRHRLFKHIIDIGPAYLRSEAGETEVRTGELVNVATEGVDALDVYYSQYLPQIALAVLIPGCIMFFVFRADFLSGMVLLLTAPLFPIFMYLIGSAAETLTRKQWLGLSRMSAYFLDVLQGLTTLKSLGRSKDQVAVIKKVSEQYRQSTMEVLRVTFLSALVLELIATLSTAVVAVEVGIRLLYGKMAFEQAFFILLLAPEFYQPLRLLGSRFHAAMAGIEASKRLFAILDIPETMDNSTSGNIGQLPLKEKQLPAIIIKDVSYMYSNNRPALKKVSFEIPAGKMTALMGESGSGKTTLTWLLLQFLRPQSGDILVNGLRLSEIPAQQWRDDLAWVSQNPYLFNDTIAANIKLARPGATEVDIQNAARLAHADEFINHLPEGYSTQIGERGARLSAGEAQRIALARAFLKDAPLLILDEATSHLDPETDSLLKESLTRLSNGRTVLVIAHQQSTLSMADQVIKLSHGQLEEIKEFKPSTMPFSRGLQSMVSPSTTYARSGITGVNLEHEQLEIKEEHAQPVLPRLISLLSPFAGRILLSVILGFATIASGIGLMATSAYIISAAALHPSIAELQVAIVAVRFFGVSRGVFRYLERLVSHDVTFRLLARWRVWFFQALEPLAPARLLQYHSGDLLSRVIGDIGILEGFYVRAVAPPLVAILVLAVMGGFFSIFGPEFSWILITFLILAGFGMPVLMTYLSHNLGPQMVQARTILSKTIIDGIQGLPDLLTSSQPTYQIQRVDEDGNRLTRLQARMAGVSAFQSASVVLIANLCMITVLIAAIQSVSQDQLAGVLLGVISLAALMSFEAVQPLPIAAQHLEANQAAARQLYELVDAKPTVNDLREPFTLPETNHLAVQDLSFQYPARISEGSSTTFSDFGLENISFSLPLGKHIAIIGRNGAGKTTLINLLQRYWEYQIGSIQLGGVEYHQLRQEKIRSRIATIPQNPYLFSTTIRENLLIARPDASDDDIIQAARAAKLDEMIQSLPDGYNTWIGEHGMRLSAGERQRLVIARALLKHAPVLILDEPTYNLDPTTEKSVTDSIKKLSQGRSMVTITQRLVGLEAMDEILVLKDGKLVEHGSHAELISAQGLYCQMWKLYNQIL
jgi:ATP-binding cassette subfamily C protein CydCD